MLAIEAHKHNEIGPIHHWDEARFHWYAVRIFDAGRQTADFDEIAADLASEVGQVSERGNDADFRLCRRCDHAGHQQQTE